MQEETKARSRASRRAGEGLRPGGRPELSSTCGWRACPGLQTLLPSQGAPVCRDVPVMLDGGPSGPPHAAAELRRVVGSSGRHQQHKHNG